MSNVLSISIGTIGMESDVPRSENSLTPSGAVAFANSKNPVAFADSYILMVAIAERRNRAGGVCGPENFGGGDCGRRGRHLIMLPPTPALYIKEINYRRGFKIIYKNIIEKMRISWVLCNILSFEMTITNSTKTSKS